jgi:hypothetical protein
VDAADLADPHCLIRLERICTAQIPALIEFVITISPRHRPYRLIWVARRFPYSAKGERPVGSRSQICSKWHVICAGVRHVIGVFSRLLGAIELANRFGTNEPGPHVLRFRILLGAAFQLQCLFAATKRALYFDVSAFGERGSDLILGVLTQMTGEHVASDIRSGSIWRQQRRW